MAKTLEQKQEAPKPVTEQSASLPVLVRVTRADRLRIASLLAR
jgi:hypothetical protein